jgi:phenylacetate-CoA ligase
LIRYRTGDRAVLSETSSGFVLDKVIGRVHDLVEIGGRRFATHYIQDVLNRIGGIREFQIEVCEHHPVLRIVPEDGAKIEGISDSIDRYWQGAMGVEFITASELRLLGGRLKFRHVVPPSDVAAAGPLQPND